MATGKPFLAVWSADNTLRLFRLSAAKAFVQVGAASVTQYGSFVTSGRYPDMEFLHDGTILACTSGPVSNWYGWQTFNTDMEPAQTISQAYVGGFGGGIGAFARYIGYNHSHSPDPQVSANARFIAPDGKLQEEGNRIPWGDANIVSAALAPSGKFYVMGSSVSGASVWYPRTPSWNGRSLPTFDTPAQKLAFPGVGNVLRWSDDGRFLYVIDRAQAKVFLFEDQNGALVLVGTLDKPNLGLAYDVAPSWNGRFVAVSYFDGSNYITKVYRRYTYTFVEIADLGTNIGRLLHFSADDNLIVDAGSKTAASLVDGQWQRSDAVMANIPANARVQQISLHRDSPTADMKLYNGALDEFCSDLTSLDMKLKLLSPSYIFDAAHTLASTDAFTVSGGTWPSEGLALSNANWIANGVNASLVADDLSAVFVESATDLSFRYALIYATNKAKPLVLMDFKDAQTLALGHKITFKASVGLIKVGP